MIYLVTQEQSLFQYEQFKLISVEESLELLKPHKMLQLDTETMGLDPHIDKCLLLQLGTIDKSAQVVIDTTTIDPRAYKELIEERFIIGQNLNFDSKVLFVYDIIIKNCWDCMIVEQLIYLGFPSFMVGASEDIIDKYCEAIDRCPSWEDWNAKQRREYLAQNYPSVSDFITNHSGVGLKALCYRYLHLYMSKEVRGQIIWKGICPEVIEYAAGDVTPLYDIMQKQLAILRQRKEVLAAKVECEFVICNAYYEWCGVHLNVPLWEKKMKQDETKREEALKALNQYVINYGDKRFFKRDLQGDLFEGFHTDPYCTINWNSNPQVIPFLTILGFKCKGIDKKSKEEKDSIDASVLTPQRNVNPEFYDVYMAYTAANKVCTTYGQNYLNAINPKTNRIHTTFRQLGTDTGRLACGSQEQNSSLARLKGLPTKTQKDTALKCAYPQVQNLPADELTRACFSSEKGNAFISIDYKGEESVLMADFSQDEAMINVFLNGEDMHSTVAYMIFPNEIPRDTPIKDIKKLFKHLRQEAKGPEFKLN